MSEEHPDNDSNVIVTYGNLAWVHSFMGNVTEAETYTEKSFTEKFKAKKPGRFSSFLERPTSEICRRIRMAPDNLSVVLHVAKFMKKEQFYDKALKVLLEMLKKVPDSSRLHHEIANNYRWKAMQMNDIHNPELLGLCIQHLEKGTSLNPGYIYPRLELALRYAEQKQMAKAEQKFTELFALPDLKPADRQAWHRMYGDFKQYRLGSERAAVEHYKQGMMLGRVSTEWIACKNRLRKVLQHDRRDTYEIRTFFHSFRTENKDD
ncbi:interferon-induced protein with tetratricopeptide repeats 1-like [Sinocyclocheilus grahami]|uniref:interferon-induced protein with tetratricopeptide repeats 1-like n=1 Tax=Sinocyclocheilus grahami TaxID=75366 RepID=UPI0007ACE6F6|nr:PREDICTED: interferon-induced protein with tetratricopeptide repeats 1-like [Sinocyclocheilus grahami]